MQSISTLIADVFPNQKIDFEPNNASIKVLTYALTSFKQLNQAILTNCENIKKQTIAIQQQNNILQTETPSEFNSIHRDLANASAILQVNVPFAHQIARKLATLEVEIIDKNEQLSILEAQKKELENHSNGVENQIESAIQKSQLSLKLNQQVAYMRKVIPVLKSEIERVEMELIAVERQI